MLWGSLAGLLTPDSAYINAVYRYTLNRCLSTLSKDV